MNRTLFVILATTFMSQAALSATGFKDGNTYRTVRISGKVHVDCEYDGGSGFANHDCQQEVLLPVFASYFQTDRPTQATYVLLSVKHADGSVVNTQSRMDSRTGLSIDDFNLWAGSGRRDIALLEAGQNTVKFTLKLATGQIERTGEFTVTASANGADQHTCRSGRMYSDRSADCRRPAPSYICGQYFRYENYCGAGSIFE